MSDKSGGAECDKLEEIRKAFRVYDKDGNGYVTLQEAHAVLQAVLGFEMEQTKRLVDSYDKNRDGRLTYDEFAAFYSKVTQNCDELFALFRKFDRTGNGLISLSDARQVLRQMAFEDEDTDALFRLHDRNGDGVLQFDEFVQFWKTYSNVSDD